MILSHITPTTSKTFDTAFNNACKLIIHDTYHRYHEYYSEGIDTKKHHYDDFIIKAIHGKTLFSLDDIGLILNALMNGYNASNNQYPFGKQVNIDDNLDLIIKIYKFITNTDKTRSKMKPFLELYSKQHNSISINNICSLLENNVPWPFAHEATWLSPVSMNTLLAKYPANDNWWLERFDYNNKLTPIQSFDAIRLSRLIDNTNKLNDNDKKALIIKLFTNNLPINTCLLNSIIDYYDNAFTSTRLLVKAFTEFIHCEAVESITIVDDNTAEQCIHDVSRFFHSKKNMSILNKYCKGSIIRLLANVINDDTLNDMARMMLFRMLNTIYSAYEHHYESFYDDDTSYSVSYTDNYYNIFNLVNCRAVLKYYPEIIHDIIYYPTEYVEEAIKNLGSIL